jgi:hypothetical protein
VQRGVDDRIKPVIARMIDHDIENDANRKRSVGLPPACLGFVIGAPSLHTRRVFYYTAMIVALATEGQSGRSIQIFASVTRTHRPLTVKADFIVISVIIVTAG